MGMMCGWLSAAAVRASRLNRSAIPSPMRSRAGSSTLIATLRSRARSWARYTVAMPPCPTSAGLGRRTREGRHQHDPRGRDEARVDVRLVGVDVEARRAEPPLLQGEGQRLLADQIAPRGIDENGGRLYLAQCVTVDDAF